MRVAIPYVVTLREAEVVLPARYIDTPTFGVTITFALDVVLETIIIVVPLLNDAFEVQGMYKFTFAACV
jgi:hypothetical protein